MKLVIVEDKQENNFWTRTKQEFEKETDLTTFKNWPVVRSIPIYKENEFTKEYTREVEELLQQLPDEKREKWFPILKEPFLGHTDESYARVQHTILNGVQCTSWTLKSAHHILTYETMSGKSILEYDQIVDFGAGIGETARLIKDLGFAGDYYIYDFPQVYRVSNFYLGGWAKTVDHYNKIPSDRKTLFIGTWSLSEVPFEYRNEIVSYFKGCDFLIIFQNSVFDYNNQIYFINQFPYASDTFYRLKAISWHPGGAGNFYIVASGVN